MKPSLAIAAAALALSLGSAASLAQDKTAASAAGEAKITEIVSDDKLRAYIITYKPGDERPAESARGYRVVRALKGGTLERTFPDGKKELRPYKTGDTRIVQPGDVKYSTRNVGKTELQLYTVEMK